MRHDGGVLGPRRGGAPVGVLRAGARVRPAAAQRRARAHPRHHAPAHPRARRPAALLTSHLRRTAAHTVLNFTPTLIRYRIQWIDDVKRCNVTGLNEFIIEGNGG